MAAATRPQVVILGGPNGAGKSTCAPLLLRDTFGVREFVNADVLAAGLSAYNRTTVDFHAGRLMAQRLRELADREESFGFETTLASRSYAPWLRRLRKTGYAVELVYLWVSSVDLAVRRVKQRVAEGGHDVPEDVVRRRYGRSVRNLFLLYKPIAENWTVWENTTNGPPRRIAFGSGSSGDTVLDPDAWHRLRELAE